MLALGPGFRRGDEWGDGVMIEINGEAYAVKGPLLLRWSHGGYMGAMRRTATLRARLLTPPAIVRILAAGYKPRWHGSALTGDWA